MRRPRVRVYVEVDGGWHRLPVAFFNYDGTHRFPHLAGRCLRSMTMDYMAPDGSMRLIPGMIAFEADGSWDIAHSNAQTVAHTNAADRAARARRMRVPDLRMIRAAETAGGRWRLSEVERTLVAADVAGRLAVPRSRARWWRRRRKKPLTKGRSAQGEDHCRPAGMPRRHSAVAAGAMAGLAGCLTAPEGYTFRPRGPTGLTSSGKTDEERKVE
jgi:hypothetical protein